MGGGSPPKPPDPAKTASAQTATNIGTAIAQQNLQNINQNTPYGSLNYEQTGEYTYTDPLNDKQHVIPQYTATQTLSPEQQATFDQNQRAQQNLATLGANQSGRLDDLLSRPLDTASLPAAGDPAGIRRANLQTGLNGPQFQQAGAGPELQGATAGPGLSGNIGDAGDITRSYGTDYSEDRRRVEDALMQRLNPYLQRDKQALEQRLADQGIGIGSEAYMRAMDDYGRQANDARLGAILSGGQEQSRLAGLEAARAGFENSAQSQAFGQNLTGAQFGNQTAQQTADNALQRRDYNNQIAQQGADNTLQRTQYNNQMAQQAFGNEAQAAQFGNQAALQQANADSQLFDAQNTARNQALQQGFAIRNQPLNELSAILSGTQVQEPNFINPQTAQIANTDYAGLVNQNYAQQMGQYNAQQQQQGQLIGGLLGLGGSLGGAFIDSDRRLKTDIRRIGTADNGLPIYLYRYKAGGPAHIGFMADEVERVNPAAVAEMPNGFQAVDYRAAVE